MISKDFQNIKQTHLSWIGKIAAFKMQTLPKILYLFRAIPIPIPSSFFKILNTKLRNLVWNNKKPRVAFSILTSSKNKGGMNLPDMHKYYYATLLDQMKYWFFPNDDKLWLSIEREITKGNDLFALSVAYMIFPKVIVPKLLSIKATLLAWKFLVSNFHALGHLQKIPIPLRALDYCRGRLSMNKWIAEGFNFYVHLPSGYKATIDDKLNKLNHLQSFNPHQDFEIPSLIWSHLTINKPVKHKSIAFFYKVFSQYPKYEKNPNMYKWEKDLGQSFSDECWYNAMRINQTATSCLEHWDNSQKILNRWYLTPYKLAKIYPSTSPLCWRCTDQVGSLFHILWSCKNLTSFWNSISTFIASLTGNLLKLSPAMALLGINLDTFPFQYRILVANILIAARLTITKMWKSIEAPNLCDVILRVNTQAYYELLLALKNYNVIHFKKHWYVWIIHPKASTVLKDLYAQS